MGNKLTTTVAGLCACGMLLVAPLSASADTYSSLVKQKNSVTKQKQAVKSDLEKLKSQIETLTGNISKTQIEIGKIQAEVTKLNQSIAETQKRIDERQKLLKDRMVASYKNGGSSVNILEVLMGADSFGDFINRAVAIYNITDHDKDMIQKQMADQKLLKDQKAKVKKDLAKTEQKLQELNQLVAKIKAIQSEKQTTLNDLNSKENKLLAQIQKENARKTASVTRPNSGQTVDANTIVQMAYIPQSAANGDIGDLVSAARRYIGHSSYGFGAMDPVHGVFDCSGFVNWAYQQIGINLGTRSTSGLQYVGSQVSRSELRPGDLVFFNTYKNNGHVGIYIGGGQFIGSQNGTGVAIVSLSHPYWNSRYSTARRVLH